MIVLCSVEAASDPAFDARLAALITEHGADRLLLVRLDGRLSWDADTSNYLMGLGSCVSPSLRGAFEREPRHVDLTRSGNGTASLRERIRDAAAELAAPMLVTDKAELLGIESQRFRRRIRVAAAVVAVLAVATTVALVLALRTTQQNDETRAERDTAQALLAAADARALARTRPETAAVAALEAWSLRPAEASTHRGLMAAADELLRRWPIQTTDAGQHLEEGQVLQVLADADRDFVLLADLTGTAVVLDATTYEVRAARRVADGPVVLGLAPNDRIVAIDPSSRIAMLDHELSVVAEVLLPEDTIAFGGSTDGTRLLYTDLGGRIFVIDLSTTDLGAELLFEATPADLPIGTIRGQISQLVADGDDVYVYFQDGVIARYSLRGDVEATATTGIQATSNLVVTTDLVAVGLAGGSLSVFDKPDLGRPRQSFQAIGAAPQQIAYIDGSIIGTTGGGEFVGWDLESLELIASSQVSSAGAVPFAIRGDQLIGSEILIVTDATDLRRSTNFGTETVAGNLVAEGYAALGRPGGLGDGVVEAEGAIVDLDGGVRGYTSVGAEDLVDAVQLDAVTLLVTARRELVAVTETDQVRAEVEFEPNWLGLTAVDSRTAVAPLTDGGLMVVVVDDAGEIRTRRVALPGFATVVGHSTAGHLIVGTREGVVLEVGIGPLVEGPPDPDRLTELPGEIAHVASLPGQVGFVAIASGAVYVVGVDGQIEHEIQFEYSTQASIADLAVSPDGRWAAAAITDGRVVVWDIEDGSQLGVYAALDAFVRALRFDGADHLLTADTLGRVRRWPIGASELADRLCSSVSDPPSDACG